MGIMLQEAGDGLVATYDINRGIIQCVLEKAQFYFDGLSDYSELCRNLRKSFGKNAEEKENDEYD